MIEKMLTNVTKETHAEIRTFKNPLYKCKTRDVKEIQNDYINAV